MNKAESMAERNTRLRKLVASLVADNKALRESDAAWAMTVNSLKREIADLKFEDRIRVLNWKQWPWWRRLYVRVRYWRERRHKWTAMD